MFNYLLSRLRETDKKCDLADSNEELIPPKIGQYAQREIRLAYDGTLLGNCYNKARKTNTESPEKIKTKK